VQMPGHFPDVRAFPGGDSLGECDQSMLPVVHNLVRDKISRLRSTHGLLVSAE